MRAYKLVRQLNKGELSPLFINKKLRLPFNTWLDAEEIPTKGFAIRKGWHCTLKPNAPHLSSKNRVWIEVEIEDYSFFERPESQGGMWVLAQRMKVLRVINK